MRKEYYINHIEKIASNVPMNPNNNFGPFIDVDYIPTSNKANNSKTRKQNNRPKDTNYFDVNTNKKIKGDKLKNKLKYLKEDATSFASNKKENFKQGFRDSNIKNKIKNNARHLNGMYPNAIGKGIGALAAGVAAKSVYDNKNKIQQLRSNDEEVNEMIRKGLTFRPRKYTPLKPNAINLGNRILRDPIPGTLTRAGKKDESKLYKSNKRKQIGEHQREVAKNKLKHFAPVALTGAGSIGLSANKYKNLIKGAFATNNAEAGKYARRALRDNKLSKQLGIALPAITLASGVANYTKSKKLNAEHSLKYLESLSPEQREILYNKYGNMAKKKK